MLGSCVLGLVSWGLGVGVGVGVRVGGWVLGVGGWGLGFGPFGPDLQKSVVDYVMGNSIGGRLLKPFPQFAGSACAPHGRLSPKLRSGHRSPEEEYRWPPSCRPAVEIIFGC